MTSHIVHIVSSLQTLSGACSCRYDLTGGYGKGGGRTRSSTQGGGYAQGGFGSPSGRSDQEHPGSRASSAGSRASSGAQRSSSGGGRSDQEHPASRARSHTSPVGGSGAQKPTVNSMGWGGGASLHPQPTVPLPRRRSPRRFWCAGIGGGSWGITTPAPSPETVQKASAAAMAGRFPAGTRSHWKCVFASTLPRAFLVAHRLAGVCSGQTVGQQGSGGAGAPAPRPAPKYNNTGWRPN